MNTTDVYFHLSGGAVVAIIEHGDMTVGDTQVSPAILEAWSAAELAGLGLVRARRVEPADIDWSAELPTTYAPQLQADGSWAYVLGRRPLDAAEAAATITAAKEAKTSELRAACAAAITAGYVSEALGAAYTYPNQATDQSNMAASVLASLMPDRPVDWTTPFWCADLGGGIWAMRPHTAAQIRQAGTDGKAHVLACQTKLSGDDGRGGLLKAVGDAETLADVAVVEW